MVFSKIVPDNSGMWKIMLPYAAEWWSIQLAEVVAFCLSSNKVSLVGNLIRSSVDFTYS